jgi:osmotically-inducible protein OsmY
MKPFRSLTVFFLAIMFGLVLGCAGTAHKETTGDYTNDSWITTLVKAALFEDPQVKATEVNVETLKGVVQLSGFVSSEAAMRQAVLVARTVTGVSSVKNDMRVK